MHLSVKALSRKSREQLNVSLGQLIRAELIKTAKRLLREDATVSEISFQLGFEEPNHFSQFFKHHTGQSPSAYQFQKYHS